MATRSRRGCIDCKQAKVKCDEVHPACGTCARRRRVCRGYRVTPARSSSISEHRTTSRRASQTSVLERRASIVLSDTSEVCSETFSDIAWSSIPDGCQEDVFLLPSIQLATELKSPQLIEALEAQDPQVTTDDDPTRALGEQPASWLSLIRSPSLLPLKGILAADKPFIEMYFMRHPSEMAMSNDFFVHEMNATVITLLQQSPIAVADSLCAIGENYLVDAPGAALVTNRKTRLLSRVRSINENGSSPELVLLLLLALSGAEITDPRSDGKGTMLPILIENVALIVQFHTRLGKQLNDASKYLTRGIARQDLLISLSRMQRTRISPSKWLDEYSMTHADRLMGLTTSLVPILANLAALAEDVQAIIDECAGDEDLYMFIDSRDLLMHRTDLSEREASIRAQLALWHPIHDQSLSFQTSRKLLQHAAAWRAAALLYLFRLFNRPGSSQEVDHIALGMSHEVMMHISGPAEDIKLSLWPLFLAACELNQQEDRDLAMKLFDDICKARPVLTTKQTKAFCVEQIWTARDQGQVWDWMYLTRRGSNLFVPL